MKNSGMLRIIGIAVIAVLLGISNVFGQESTKNNDDKTTRSEATINQTSLGMELSIPLGTLPGRAGNSLPITLNYSSKVWRIDTFKIYGNEYTQPYYGDDSDSGWTTTLQAPYLENTPIEKLVQPHPTPTPPNNLPPPPPPNTGPQTISCTAYWFNGSNVWVDDSCSCLRDSSGSLTLVRGSCNNPPPNPNSPQPSTDPYYTIPKITLHLPDGSTHDLVSTLNAILVNNSNPLPPQNTFYSIDGSNLRLENVNGKRILYLPNGNRYEYRNEGTTVSDSKYVVDNFDVDGNKLSYEFKRDIAHPEDMEGFVRRGQWKDTMGRTVEPPKPPTEPGNPKKIIVGDSEYVVPSLPNQERKYIFKWRKLEDSFAKTTYVKKYLSQLFGDVGITEEEKFNPVILQEIVMPNNKSYKFSYNEYGEIEKITYPTGSVEEFTYGTIMPFSYTSMSGLTFQGNRGVKSRVVKPDSNPDNNMPWTYNVWQDPYRIETIAPDGSKTERRLFMAPSTNVTPPILPSQMPGNSYEDRAYDKNGVLVSRTLTKWAGYSISGTGGSGCTGFCGGDNGGGGINPNSLTSGSPKPYIPAYPRVEKQLSIIMEGGKALGKMTEMEYDSNSNQFYFAQTNVKKVKSYDFVPIDLTDAQNYSLTSLQSLFTADKLLKSSETDYLYDSNYLNNGITSLPIKTEVKDKTGNLISKTQTIYDNYTGTPNNYPFTSPIHSYSGIGASMDCSNDSTPKICWQNPNNVYRGHPTTSRVWNNDDNTWIETHSQTDMFGNPIKAVDAIGNEATTEFSSEYKYAYPTKTITPAPDPDNSGHGTNQTSTTQTKYDFMTGLPLEVTDDFGQTIKTEYNDVLLRPTKTLGVNVNVPISETIYDDNYDDDNLASVTVRKQIDETNWDEATTYTDSLGRTIKTVAKDSQGDVIVETKYDNLGRVFATSNPYRNGDTVYWSKPRYDELNRVVETFAPAVEGQTGASLGVTEWGISTVPNFVGTYTIARDASGRKARSITNALGQLIRIDEPTQSTGTNDQDLGTLDNPHQPTFYKYNPQGKMVHVQQGKPGEPAIQHRYFLYDSLGRLIRVRQPEQEVNSALNKTDLITGNNEWTAKFEYDLIGNLLVTTDAENRKITNTY